LGSCYYGETCVLGTCVNACVTSCPAGFGVNYGTKDGCNCPVLPTGINSTQCSNGSTNLVACNTITSGMDYYGQNGHFPQALDYTDLVGDPLVQDNRTNLLWDRDMVTNAAQWEAVDGLCASPKAAPSVHELFGIVDFSKSSAPMSHSCFNFFSPLPTGGYLWSRDWREKRPHTADHKVGV